MAEAWVTSTVEPDELLVVNGIDVDTGEYLAPPLPVTDLAGVLRRDLGAPPGIRELRRRRQQDEDHLGVVYGRDPEDLASVGWGVVVPPDLDPAILEALAPLLRFREEQAGELFRRLEVRSGETKDDFLARHGMGPSLVDPRKVPYYLTIVGSPEQVPFDFQYQLGVPHAVGRLDLDTAAAYAGYAAAVVAAEETAAAGGAAPGEGASAPRSRRVHLFGTRHPGDVPTALSAARLVTPLAEELRQATGAWAVSSDVGTTATRARLEDLVIGGGAPDLLFTASHGVGGGGVRREVAGALLCQDWGGPLAARGPIGEDVYLAAAHLPAGAAVGPRVIFSFACYGAGTPGVSDFPGGNGGEPPEEAPGGSFTARLPQRMLGAPGGALAFVGHVDRAWSCSFLWKGLAAQVTPFLSTLLALMDGVRLGSAMESLTSRYAEITSELVGRMSELRRYGRAISDADLVGLWTAVHDARAYVVLGDPAVRAAPRGAAGLRRV